MHMLEQELNKALAGPANEKLRLLLELNVYKLKSLDLFKHASEESFFLVKSLFHTPHSVPKRQVETIVKALCASLEEDLNRLESIIDKDLKKAQTWRLLAAIFWVETFKSLATKDLVTIQERWGRFRLISENISDYYFEPESFTVVKSDYPYYRRAIRMSKDESIPQLDILS